MKPPIPTFLLALVLSLVILGALPVELLLAALPGLARQFGVSTAEAALAVSAYAVGVALAQPWVGALALRWGTKPVMVAGLALSGLAAAGAALASGLHWLLLLRVAQGFGAGSLVLVHALMASRDPRTQRLMAALAILGGLLVAVAPYVGDIVQRHFGWQALFLAYEFCAVLCVALLIGLMPDTTLATPPGAGLAAVWQALRNGPATGYAVLAALAFACHFSATLGIVVVATEHFGLPSPALALVLLGYGLASLVSESVAAGVGGYLSGNRQARAGLFVLGLSAGLLALSLREASLVWFLGPLALATLGTGLLRNGAMAQALALASDVRAAKAVGNTLTFGCAGALSSVALLAEPDVRMGLLVLYLGCTLVAALLLAAVSEHQADEHDAVNL